MAKEEFSIQCAVVHFLRVTFPFALFTISPITKINSKITAMNMKRMGYTSGTPDLMIFEPRLQYHGLFIEFKSPKGKVSDYQQTFLTSLRNRGYCAQVCNSVDMGKLIINEYFKLSSFQYVNKPNLGFYK